MKQPDSNKTLVTELPALRIDGSIAWITLRRSQHQNRLQDEDLSCLLRHFERLDADRSVRIVVLQAEVRADRPVFSAGYHIGEFGSSGPKPDFEAVMNALEALRPVTVCALNGAIYGGATDIPLSCDLVIAAADIQMQMPAARLGLHYYPQGLRRYVSRIGLRSAKLVFLTARAFDAQALLRMNYVHEVVDRYALPGRVQDIATEIAELSPLAVQSLKKSLNEIAGGRADEAVLAGRADASMNSLDFAEGRAAFAQKRKPVWTGR